MPGDDRAGLYASLVGVRKEMGDEAGAKKVAAEWLAFLDEEAARAPTPRARAVFDSFRLSAAIAVGDPARAIPVLAQSEKDLPDDYNPPARLAIAYSEVGRYDEALAAADRAMKLVYGPRKIRVFVTKAEILEKQGSKEAAKATLSEALRYAETLPKAQLSTRAVDAIKGKLAKLG
jgi:tetratricopeptide (TPR) repeat protein